MRMKVCPHCRSEKIRYWEYGDKQMRLGGTIKLIEVRQISCERCGRLIDREALHEA